VKSIKRIVETEFRYAKDEGLNIVPEGRGVDEPGVDGRMIIRLVIPFP
jgi:hypothetical protein